MKFRGRAGYLALTSALAVSGALAGWAISFSVRPVYVSSAVLSVDTRGVDGAEDTVTSGWHQLLSRRSLRDFIQLPSLNLYAEEREHFPLEDMIEKMRKDVRLDFRKDCAITVSFRYIDPKKAASALQALVNKMSGMPEFGWRIHQIAAPTSSDSPESPDRLLFALCGLGIGLVVAAVTCSILWRPVWSWKIIVCGLAGAAALWIIGVMIPGRYMSRAVIRVRVPAERLATVSPERARAEMMAWERNVEDDVLSNARLEEIALRSSVRLYSRESIWDDPETRLLELRNKIGIEHPASQACGPEKAITVTISFRGTDAVKAQQVVNAMTGEFLWAAKHRGRARFVVEVLDTANLPDESNAPRGMMFAVIGLIGGILISTNSIPANRRPRT